jgi:deoxyribose-phosphate aldolase
MLEKGADELDFVINVRLLKYDPEACFDELDACVGACRAANPKAELKLIIECCYLSDDEKVLACVLAKRAGFDFVKTSTGFGPSGATEDDVKLMRKVVGKKMGVKAAGGIRTRDDAEKMIKAGASRLGCSASIAICG